MIPRDLSSLIVILKLMGQILIPRVYLFTYLFRFYISPHLCCRDKLYRNFSGLVGVSVAENDGRERGPFDTSKYSFRCFLLTKRMQKEAVKWRRGLINCLFESPTARIICAS